MYINSVLSFLGAWQMLQKEFNATLEEVQQVLAAVNLDDCSVPDKDNTLSYRISPQKLTQAVEHSFSELGWGRARLPSRRNNRRFRVIDFLKNGIGVEFQLGKSAYVNSDLFVNFPLFIRAKQLRLAIILVPMDSLNKHMFVWAGSFEQVQDQLADAQPLPLKYPFAILGVSENPSPIKVEELTSDLDRFLIEEFGFSLEEIKILPESPQYEFKEELPEGKSLSRIVCALANLEGGGVILIGVSDSEDLSGISKGKPTEDVQKVVSSIIQDNCVHYPHFVIHIFDTPSDTTRCVVAIRIREIDYKPCMVDGKVYVRDRMSTRVAGPEDIRQLLLGVNNVQVSLEWLSQYRRS